MSIQDPSIIIDNSPEAVRERKLNKVAQRYQDCLVEEVLVKDGQAPVVTMTPVVEWCRKNDWPKIK